MKINSFVVFLCAFFPAFFLFAAQSGTVLTVHHSDSPKSTTEIKYPSGDIIAVYSNSGSDKGKYTVKDSNGNVTANISVNSGKTYINFNFSTARGVSGSVKMIRTGVPDQLFSDIETDIENGDYFIKRKISLGVIMGIRDFKIEKTVQYKGKNVLLMETRKSDNKGKSFRITADETYMRSADESAVIVVLLVLMDEFE